MQVIVQNNNIDGAIKLLKKKLAQDGFFAEMKERRFYEKPSVAKKKKRAKAEKKRRKARNTS
jgi:small subunit ribosomal protein S21